MLASKYCDYDTQTNTCWPPNRLWAKVVVMSLRALNYIKIKLLYALCFDLSVHMDDFKAFFREVLLKDSLSAFDRARQQQR